MSSLALNRRVFGAAATLALAAVAVPALRAQPKLEKSRVRVAVGGKGTFYNLPLTLAQQLGFFQAEGLDVEIIDHSGGAQARQAVLSGQADVCAGAFEHTLLLAAAGHTFRSFVLQGRTPQVAVGLSTRSPSAPRTLADLRGRRMGVSVPGSATQTVASLLLQRAGLLPGEVGYVGVGVGSGALQALRNGHIEAISNVDPVMTMLEQKGDVKLMADTRTLKGAEELFGGPMPGGCLYAPMAFLQKNPNTVQALAYAIVHSLKWLQTAGPADLIKAVPESYLLGDRALYLAAFGKVREGISPDGLMPEDGPRTALRALVTLGSDPRLAKLETGRLSTNDWARRAKDRFKA